MNAELFFIIPGEPQGKARAKVVRLKNGFSHSYTPEKTMIYENWIRTCYLQSGGVMLPDGSKRVIVLAYFSLPKTSKIKIAKMIAGKVRPTKKPDADNIGKCMDALNGIAWHDDACVASLRVEKLYGAEPRVEVYISSIGEEEGDGACSPK